MTGSKRHAQHALGVGQMFWLRRAQMTEEAVDGAQADITGGGLIASRPFQMIQKDQEAFDGKR